MAARLEALDRVFLAIQGPTAVAAAKAAGIDGSDLTFMHGKEPDGLIITRSGYTGEDGLEIAVTRRMRQALADKAAGPASDVEWIGLAARDSLRLESGLCLYGNDMDETTTPVEASLMWPIPKALRETGTFQRRGCASVRRLPKARRASASASSRKAACRCATARVLTDADGNEVGIINSGGFGPTVNHPVAMGYVAKSALDTGAAAFRRSARQQNPGRRRFPPLHSPSLRQRIIR